MSFRAATRSYRSLLRAARETFAGDSFALGEARKELRVQFDSNRDLTSESEIRECLETAREADEFLRNNIAQARLTSEGNYSVSLNDPASTETTSISDKHANFTVLESDGSNFDRGSSPISVHSSNPQPADTEKK